MMKKILIRLLATLLIAFLISCATAPEVKPTKPNEAAFQKGPGKLITNDGLIATYQYFPSTVKNASAIYLSGQGGQTSYKDDTSGGYTLAPNLNSAGFNFIALDYAYNWVPGRSMSEQHKIAQARGKSGLITFPTIDGKESGAENVVRNEIKAIIDFVEASPLHDKEKGIYLIGDSIGSWYSLVTMRMFPQSNIKGVVFLSPAVLSDWPEWKQPEKYPQLDAVGYLGSIVKVYGNRPGLAIGGSKDIIWQGYSTESAWDSAKFLRQKLGPNIELMEVTSSEHGFHLVESNPAVRQKIADWLTSKALK